MNDMNVGSEYFSAFAAQGLRPDGRGFLDSRTAAVSAGYLTTCDGSALVRVGGTLVAAGVTVAPLFVGGAGAAAGASPKLLVLRAVVSPGSSARARGLQGAGADDAAREVTALLCATFFDAFAADDEALRKNFIETNEAASINASVAAALVQRVPRGGVVHLTSLAMLAGEEGGDYKIDSGASEIEKELVKGDADNDAFAVGLELAAAATAQEAERALNARLSRFWTLTVDIVVLADDGGMDDAAVLAVTAALRNTRINGRALVLRATPIAASFALLRAATGGEILLLADPSAANGEGLDAVLLAPGGGVSADSLDDNKRAMARAHVTLVCDAGAGAGAGAGSSAGTGAGTGAGEGASALLVTRKLGGEPLPRALLRRAALETSLRASTLFASLVKCDI